jgi:hypothetical protein
MYNLKFKIMKKLFTLLVLVLSMLFASTSTLFAQKNLVYVVKTNATADQKIIDYLNANGYVVTVSVADGLVPAGDFDLAVISDTNGSIDAVWAAFRNAPMPFVALSAHAARNHNNALGWTAGARGNSDKMTVTPVEPSHPILAGITNPTFHTDKFVDPTWGDFATQWTTFPALPVGATVITTVTRHPKYDGTNEGFALHPEGDLPQIIAFEEDTEVTSTITLANRAVIAGFHNGANQYLTDEGLKAIKQACDWVAGVTATDPTDPTDPTNVPVVVADNLLMKRGEVLVNPSNLKVEIYNISGALVLSSNEATINLSDLPRGIFIAKSKVGVLKFVK